MVNLIESLPSVPDTAADVAAIRNMLSAPAPKLVVLDDDPTGTQTVHGIEALADWSVDVLAAALADDRTCFYILTNSRSLPEAEAAALYREIGGKLKEAARKAGRTYALVSRSDSTLRGHFPAEPDALAGTVEGGIDAVFLIPAFLEGGRYTIGNVHYVADGERLVPAAETEFARDATFGYRNSDLTRWVEEKTGGRIRAADVASVSIDLLRTGGAGQVRDHLLGLQKGAVAVVNAAAYADLEVFVHGLLQAEAAGKSYLFRTGAGFVRVRAGLEARPPLTADQIVSDGRGGLVVVGSYIAKSSRQLEAVLKVDGVRGIELVVDRLADPSGREAEIGRVTTAADDVMRGGRTAVIYTSRNTESKLGRAGELKAARVVSDALIAVVRALESRPRFFIAKGGITSHDLAVNGLGMQRTLVLGQAIPGVPVWRAGEETKWPGLSYVVFPGNVGGPEAIAELVRRWCEGQAHAGCAE